MPCPSAWKRSCGGCFTRYTVDGMTLFYELLQVAIGAKDTLSRVPSRREWVELHQAARKQALVGIGFSAVQKLYGANPWMVKSLPSEIKLRWFAEAANIRSRNAELDRQCKAVQDDFRKAGLESCILKGQGVAAYYDKDIAALRQSGDIDIWVDGTWREVMDYVNARTPNREFDMKHTHLMSFPDTAVEVHWWPSMPVNPWYAKNLRTYYREQAATQCRNKVRLADGVTITAPDARFEAVHILYHVFNHFLYEGVGLRQMMDLYFVLTNGKFTQRDKESVLATMSRVGLSVFAPAAMWVLCDVFGMKDEYCICRPDERKGKVLLSEIEHGGNFGHFSEENRVADETFARRMVRRLIHRFRLVMFNPLALVVSPFTKMRVMLWRRKVIREYNL